MATPVIDSSSSEDDEFFHQASVQPYQFEPTYSKEQVESRRREREDRETIAGSSEAASQGERLRRTEDKFWCTCDGCVLMPTYDESVCCHEIEQAQFIVDRFDPHPEGDSLDIPDARNQKCVTLHPDFEAHLNEGVLDTYMYFRSHQYNWKQFPKPRGPGGTLTNAQYRLVAYRFILDWLLQGERLGKKKRIPLPACVVHMIRSKYPAEDHLYRGFRYAELPTV